MHGDREEGSFEKPKATKVTYMAKSGWIKHTERNKGMAMSLWFVGID